MIRSGTTKHKSNLGYDPFGMLLVGRLFPATGGDEYRFGFNGQEQDDEVYGNGNLNTAMFWEYDTRLGRRWNVDPIVNPSTSGYVVFNDNPVLMTDIKGDAPSTHTDDEGNVIAVYDDGDLGVYKHGSGITKDELDKSHTIFNTSIGGEKKGETEFWDEFITPKKGKVEGRIIYDDRPEVNWDFAIDWMHEDAESKDLSVVIPEIKPHGTYDLKTNDEWATTQMTGRLLNGKYATARSAGNFLAGWIGATGTFQGMDVSPTTFMKLAGALEQNKFNAVNASRIVLFGKSFGPAPYYGEDVYSGRMIQLGLDYGATTK